MQRQWKDVPCLKELAVLDIYSSIENRKQQQQTCAEGNLFSSISKRNVRVSGHPEKHRQEGWSITLCKEQGEEWRTSNWFFFFVLLMGLWPIWAAGLSDRSQQPPLQGQDLADPAWSPPQKSPDVSFSARQQAGGSQTDHQCIWDSFKRPKGWRISGI